jgi:RimJ/RimL family protein N-acetyltransferase
MLSLIAESYGDFGLRGLHRRLLSALDVYRELGFYVYEMNQPPPPRKAAIGLIFSIMRPEELDEYCALRPTWGRHLAEARIRAGGTCFMARHAGEIAGFGWATGRSDWIEFIGHKVEPREDEIYLADTYTQPRFRAKGVSSALIAFCCHHYFGLGKRRAQAAILPYNIASIRSFEKAGFRLVARRGYRGFGRWRNRFDRPVG